MKIPNSTSAARNAAAGMARLPAARRRASATSDGRTRVRARARARARARVASATTFTFTSTFTFAFTATPVMSVRLADHALDQVVHLLERDVRLALLAASRNHDLAGVVLERALVDDHGAGHELGLGVVGLLLGGGGD